MTGRFHPKPLILRVDSEPLWFSVIIAPERVGRWLMDFGLGSLVEKFEEHLGRWPTRLLLWLAAFAIFIGCVRLIVIDGVMPVIEFIRGVGGNSWLAVAKALGWTFIGATIFAFVVMGIFRVSLARVVKRAEGITRRALEMAARLDRQITNFEDEIMRYEAETGRTFGKRPLTAEILADREAAEPPED